MADSKITALTSIGTITDPAVDPLVIVDVSDTSMAATGTTKKVTLNNLLACSPTATLASATITGALTANGGATALYINSSLFAGSSGNFTNLYCKSSGYVLYNSAGSFPILNLDNSGVATFSDGAGGTRMTLNATGLGVGVSPAYKLDVNGTANCNFLRVTSASGTALSLVNTTSGLTYTLYSANAASNGFDGFAIFNGTSYDLRIVNGNVGIGVTPSAFGANQKALQVGSFASIYNDAFNGAAVVGFNVYQSGNSTYNYIATGITAARYEQRSASHFWYSAGSGTAGNPISFNDAKMTLDASGNLGIGVTPSAWNSAFKAVELLGGNINTSSTANIRLVQNAVYTTSGFVYKTGGLAATNYLQTAGAHTFFNAPVGTNANDPLTFTQAMTLDASGNLLVGTTAAAGSASNSTKTVGGIFSSVNGTSASTASGSAVTLFASQSEATYMVSAYVLGTGAPATYNAVAIVKTNAGVATLTTISSATNLTISISGLNVQVTQTSGVSQVITYNVIRIS